MKVFILLGVLAVALAKECGENQHYDSCGTACPLTCDNYQNPPIACILMCNPGCHCDEGYVKTKDGRCVKPETCPLEDKPVCGENERYTTCGKACPLTCDNYKNPPKICPLMCIIGCECQTGFVKTSDGQCVRPEDCPAESSDAVRAPGHEICSLPADTGPCRARFERFYFDSAEGVCKTFIYGGCRGNANNFKTETGCKKFCGAKQD